MSAYLDEFGLWPTPMAAHNRKSRRAMDPSIDNGRRSGGGQSSPPGLAQAVELDAGTLPVEYDTPEALPPRLRRVYDRVRSTWPPRARTASPNVAIVEAHAR